MRCGILADQSLMLRRRRNDHDKSSFIIDDAASTVDDLDDHKADDIVPQIYACATMWHETRFEMTQLLKSIFRYIHEALPGVWGIQGEGLFIFRDLGRRVIYFQGFWEKA